MITIEEIFNLNEDDLKIKLIEYDDDETNYSNNLEKINAVIIHSFNNSLLISEEMEIVESTNYNRVMKSNPKSYSDFLNLLTHKKKINININPELLKSWNTFKVTTLEGHNKFVSSVVVTDQYIISGSIDKTIKIWDLSTFELVASLEGHTSGVNSLVVSDKYIISGSYDRTIKIWDLSTFKLVTTLEGHTDIITSLVVSSVENTTDLSDNIGKQYIISGSYDKTIKIWDFSTFKLVETLEGHTNWINSVAVSKDNKYIISGSSDDTIKIWDLSTFKLVATLEGHTSAVMSVAVSDIINTPDKFGNNIGKQYIISGSDDKTIKIWEKN